MSPGNLVYRATAPTHTYTLSLHDALPICHTTALVGGIVSIAAADPSTVGFPQPVNDEARTRQDRGAIRQVHGAQRSEEHTSELQSHSDLVCRLLLEQNKTPRS